MHLVTGAAGFLGRPFVDRLARSGTPVRALVRPGSAPVFAAPVETREADLTDSEATLRAAEGCDVILHLAGKAHDFALGPDAASAFHRANVEGTRNLLAAAERFGASTLVFFSSVKAVGEGGDACVDESAAPAPRTPYGASKLEAERLVLEFGRNTGARATVLRLPLVYGPGVKGNLRAMLHAIRRGVFPPLPPVANRRSLASVDDAWNAALLARDVAAAAGRTYFVTDGCAYSSREIYDAMRAALGLPERRWAIPLSVLRGAASASDAVSRLTGRVLPFGRDSLEKLVGSAWYDNTRIRNELGFEPATTLAAALPAIVAFDRGTA
jgi:nucleoside-diphosphate-sugar epimerase